MSNTPRVPSSDGPADTSPSAASGASDRVFVVKLRNVATRSWGNQSEVRAASWLDAAESVSGEPSLVTSGPRDALRARVWLTPFGSTPDVPFYMPQPG